MIKYYLNKKNGEGYYNPKTKKRKAFALVFCVIPPTVIVTSVAPNPKIKPVLMVVDAPGVNDEIVPDVSDPTNTPPSKVILQSISEPSAVPELTTDIFIPNPPEMDSISMTGA